MSREEKKTEEQLKALLRLPANKRCVNCDSLVRDLGGQTIEITQRSLEQRAGAPSRSPQTISPPPLSAGPPVCCFWLQRVRMHRVQRRAVSLLLRVLPPPLPPPPHQASPSCEPASMPVCPQLRWMLPAV